MSDPFIRQDGPGTFSPDKRRVSTQDINNMRQFINESIDERLHELIGQKHAVIRGGTVTINGGDNTKFDVEETFAVIHGQRIKVPAQVALTPGGVAATRFVVLKYNLNESRQVTISATPHDLDKEDGFSLAGQDADAGSGEIRLATLVLAGPVIESVTSNLDNLRVDIPSNSRILTVNTSEVKQVLNIETADVRYGELLTVTPNDLGNFKHWPGMIGGSLSFEKDLTINTRALPVDTDPFSMLFRTIKIGTTPAQAGLTIQDEVGSFVPPTYDNELIDPARTGVGSELKSIRPQIGHLWDVETPSAMANLSDVNGFRYKIEGVYYQGLIGSNIIISWWVLPSISGTFSVIARRSDGLRSFIREWTIVAGDVGKWTRKQVSFPLNDVEAGWNFSTGVGVEFIWTLGANLTTPGVGVVASQDEVDAEAWINRIVLTSPNQTNLFSALGRTMEFCMFSTNPGFKFDFQVPSVPQDEMLLSRYVQEVHIAYRGFANNGNVVGAREGYSTKMRDGGSVLSSTQANSGLGTVAFDASSRHALSYSATKNGNGEFLFSIFATVQSRL